MTDDRTIFPDNEEKNNNTQNNDVNFQLIDNNDEEISKENTFSENNDDVIEVEDILKDDQTGEAEYSAVEKQGKKKRKIAGIVAAAILFGVVAGAASAITNSAVLKLAASKIKLSSTQEILTKGNSELIESPIADIVEQCMPSVVSITNKSVTEIMTFFGRYSQENVSSGSGIIIGKNDTELLIVTNYHVVSDSQELNVIFSDAKTIAENVSGNSGDENGVEPHVDDDDVVSAKVKGYDSDKDLAVIAVTIQDMSAELLSKIKVATIGDSSTLRAGERVIAIGNALGYGKSVTTGIVSATNREVTLESQKVAGQTVTNKFIQTDAAINSGNSGGALLNMNGELVGINSVKIVSSGVEGMGYAIPISDVEAIIGELMVRETRELVDEDKQGFLGITFENVSSEISEAYGMPVGVYVKTVTKGSAADKAGIKKGYIITKFDNHTVSSGAELQSRLAYYKAGETKPVTVQVNTEQGYEERELTVTLDSKKEGTKKMEKEMED